MSKISLNASMRSNLLSLQNISKQQNQTQLRLSTGLKVNSAIDNPSSYYAAQSLSNRAGDLRSLLDSMGQGIQTIKAANEGIETAGELLEIAQATVTDISEKVSSENVFAIVTNKTELLDAVNQWENGNGLIVVAEDIDMGSTRLELKDNQQLMGLNYIDGSQKRAELSWTFSAGSADGRGMITAEDNLLSDLKITYNSDNIDSNNKTFNAIYNDGHTLTLHNVDLTLNHTSMGTGNTSVMHISGIENVNSGAIHMSGNMTLNASASKLYGLRIINHQNKSCQLILEADSKLDIKTNNTYNNFIYSGTNVFLGKVTIDSKSGNTNFFSNANVSFYNKLSIRLNATSSTPFYYSDVSFYGPTVIEVSGHNQWLFRGGNSNIYGNMTVNITGETQANPSRLVADNHNMNIHSGAEVLLNLATEYSVISDNSSNQINIASGAKLGIKKDNSAIDKLYQANKDTNITTSSTEQVEDFADINGLSVVGTFSQAAYDSAMADLSAAIAEIGTRNYETTLNDKDKISNFESKLAQVQKYTDTLNQYDALIQDSGYKGVNLLQGNNFRVIFNENRSSAVEVLGQDLQSDKIGLQTRKWKSLSDIKQSFEELCNAKNALRSAASQLGNYYSIVTTREDFTNNLINVLEEGADKLTLADMNEESANMLALQTRQSLAVNSLSLASQASQAILKLF